MLCRAAVTKQSDFLKRLVRYDGMMSRAQNLVKPWLANSLVQH